MIPVKKVLVIGCPGSGKSTFSKKLHNLTGLPLFHLDMIYWNTDRTHLEKDVFKQRLQNILEREEWIIDGNYGSTMEYRLGFCDTVFFLDYSSELCLKGISDRKCRRRSDIPWVEAQGETDAEFEDFVKSYNTESRPKVTTLLEKYADKQIFIFTDRQESDVYLNTILK